MLPQGMKRQYYDGSVRMYEGLTGRTYIADIYDKMMNPVKSKPVVNKTWKGVNANRRNNWINDLKSY